MYFHFITYLLLQWIRDSEKVHKNVYYRIFLESIKKDFFSLNKTWYKYFFLVLMHGFLLKNYYAYSYCICIVGKRNRSSMWKNSQFWAQALL